MVRLGAMGGAALLTSLAIAPAMAADVVAQSSANALTLSIAGNGQGSGTVTATHDGTSQSVEGRVNPPIDVLGNQGLLNVGVLAQDAVATVQGRAGVSAACAGVAGDGGAVAQVGDSECITPGQPVGLSIANLDLTGTVLINPESALGPLSALQPVIDQLVGPLTAAISEGLAPLGDLAIGGTLGAVQSQCEATPGDATGGSTLTDSRISATLPGAGEFVLLQLPVNPPPNTKVVTDLDVVVDAVLQGVEVELTEALTGALAPIVGALAPVQQINELLIAAVADALAPLEENVLDITLNKQSTPEDGRIEVTAIDLSLLPAAAQFAGAPLVSAQIASVTCGANAVFTPPSDTPEDDTPPSDDLPDIPTEVDAGAAGGGFSAADGAIAAGLLMLAGAAGLSGYRRFSVR